MRTFQDQLVLINGDSPALAAEFSRRGARLVTDASGRVDVLVNCADALSADYRAAFESDIFASLKLMQAVLPGMIERRWGRIIQVCSLNPAHASKFALEGMSRSARIELHRHGVRILLVWPGLDGLTELDAGKIVNAAARGRRELVLTTEGKRLWWLRKFSPALADRVLLRHLPA
jgi:NAD(P)-dependent dehydrogenase (short-subunit alcohol dehydrogenase family)